VAVVVEEEEAVAVEGLPTARAALKKQTKKQNRSTEEQSINNACIASRIVDCKDPKSTYYNCVSCLRHERHQHQCKTVLKNCVCYLQQKSDLTPFEPLEDVEETMEEPSSSRIHHQGKRHQCQ